MNFIKRMKVGIKPNQPLLHSIFSLLEDLLTTLDDFHRSIEWVPNRLLLHLPSEFLESVSNPHLPLHQLPYSALEKYDKRDAKRSRSSLISIFEGPC